MLQPGLQSLGQLFAQAVLDVGDAHAAVVTQSHAHHRLIGAAGPEVDAVDRVGWRADADIGDGDIDIFRTDDILDDVERLAGELFADFQAQCRTERRIRN